MRSSILIIAALALGFVSTGAKAISWDTYTNDRFGSTAEYPANWRAGEPPENDDGLSFMSPDGTGKISIYGSYLLEDTAKAGLDIEAEALPGETVTYSHRSDTSVVTSGTTTAGRIFYRKAIVACHAQVLDSIYVEYPAGQRAAYDGIITHVAGSLRAGAGWDVKGC